MYKYKSISPGGIRPEAEQEVLGVGNQMPTGSLQAGFVWNILLPTCNSQQIQRHKAKVQPLNIYINALD